jgi:3-methyladenine DNA glycosylase AlkD
MHVDLQRYVGTPLSARGLYKHEYTTILRAFKVRHPRLHPSDLRTLSAALGKGPHFEDRILACELVAAYPRSWSPSLWSMADRWTDTAVGWGLCDTVGGLVVTRLLEADPSRFDEVRAWTRSPNLWRRRTALYAMNRWVRKGELDRPFELLLALHRDPEFWVRRAVGTWLRECWKQDRPRTERFLLAHARSLAPITITVATERAPPAFRDRLRAKARGSAPAKRLGPVRSSAVLGPRL